MENLTLGGLIAAALVVALAISQIGSAVKMIVEAVRASKAPNDKQNKRIPDWRSGAKAWADIA